MTFDKDISYVKSCNVWACKSLWAAVLQQAIEDALNHSKEAEMWLRCKNDGVGSFLWICHLFDLNPECVREIVVNRLNYQSRKSIDSISQRLHGSTLNLSASHVKTPIQPASCPESRPRPWQNVWYQLQIFEKIVWLSSVESGKPSTLSSYKGQLQYMLLQRCQLELICPILDEDDVVIQKILKHLGLWFVKPKPPPRANGPPVGHHIDYAHSQFPSYDDYNLDPEYPIDTYALWLKAGILTLTRRGLPEFGLNWHHSA